MLCAKKDFIHRTFFYSATGMHDRHSIGYLGDDAKVVRDHEYRKVVFFLQSVQQTQDSPLQGDIQRSRGLVRNQKLWSAGESYGN